MSVAGKVYAKFVRAMNRISSRIISADKEYTELNDLDLSEIENLKKEYGIEGIIFDVDGTLTNPLRELSDQTISFLKVLKREFKIYLISNNKSSKIASQANKIGINYIPHAQKPLKKPFLKAKEEMGIENGKNIIVIGDEFITDIWGGRRSGMVTGIIRGQKKGNKKETKDIEL